MSIYTQEQIRAELERRQREAGAVTEQQRVTVNDEYEARRNPSKSIGDMIRGNASEDLPNINQAGKGTLRTGVASMFGSDQDYTNAARSDGA